MNVVSRSTTVISALHINIVYDDQTTTDITVVMDDLVEIEYMNNGTNKKIKGRIADIKTEAIRNIGTTNGATGILTIDTSILYKSEKTDVNVKDIMNIVKITV